MTKKKRTPRVPTNLAESTLIYIGDNHYVEPATGMVVARIGHINVFGYEKAEHDGKRAVSVHRLVHEAVHGPIPQDLVINHINGDRADNRITNLEAVTQSENIAHSYRSGGRDRVAPHAQGQLHPMSKITDAQVEEIRKRAEDGEKVPDLAAEFGLSVGHMYKITKKRQGGRADYGTNNRPRVRPRQKATPEQQAEIQRRAAAGEHVPDLAAEFHIHPVTAYVIARAANGVRREHRKVTPEQRAEIARRVESGEPVVPLAAEFGISKGHARKITREVRRAADAIPG